MRTISPKQIDEKEPTLTLGCARLGSALTPLSRRGCILLLDAALALGVRDFDTASIYGQGDSERYIGEAFQAHRSLVSLSSKAGQTLSAKQALLAKFKTPIRWMAARRGVVRRRVAEQRSQGVPRCFDPDYIERSLAHSLRRLRTDHLDTFYLHSPEPSVLDDDNLMHRVQKMRSQGMFKAFGVSCDDEELAWKAAAHDSVQVVQFAFDGAAQGAALLEQLARRGKRAVLRGFLSSDAQRPRTQQALSHVFGNVLKLPSVTSLIVGTTNVQHLRENVAAYAQAIARKAVS